ncbi:uncharacterized protein B0H18DRAFT_1127244 [Fomitopsis serialis]|uniref:uncharacterized protein n=1 Tax=Fomitopsis serialis TaxID=139415 RepID=UPI00200867EB|nr:uncharacterized protein B0H18DRAFT_1127244 [Neoantrodia serialis]KAH9912377.1 hypothetical protein B0H18DRAFT_1127244 [Neoantrodia serialis]
MSTTSATYRPANVLSSKRYNPEYRWEVIAAGWLKGKPSTAQSILQPLSSQLCQRIPLDIYEHIMDHMDQASLYRAALVCQAWHHQSIRLLYRTIEIRQRAAFSTISRPSPAARARLATSKELRVMHRSGPLFCHAVPLTLGRAMPAVERLAFHACLQPLMHPTFARYLSAFTGVSRLEIGGFRFSNVVELRRVLCAFPRLIYLSLSRGEFTQSVKGQDEEKKSGFMPGAGPQSLRIQTLVLGIQLSSPVLEALIDWLVMSSTCRSIAHLEFWRDSLESVTSVNRLLEAIGGALLDFHEHQGRFEKRSHVDLAHNYRLRSLEMTMSRRLTETSGIVWPGIIEELLSVLSSVRSLDMQRILIHLVCRTTTAVGQMLPLAASDSGRPPLHDVLERSNFDLLREVQATVELDSTDMVSIEDNKAVAEMRAHKIVPYVRVLLAPWHKRGILTVTPIYWNLSPTYGEVDPSSSSGLLYAHQKVFYNPTYLPLGLLEPR